MPTIAYISYDRFPAAKGAAVHIAAFAHALADAFGELELVTVAADGPQVASVEPPNADGAGRGQSLPNDLPPLVTHVPLPALGPNLIERVLCFRAQLEAWRQGRRFDVLHVRSIYEGFPLARDKRRVCRALVAEINGLPSIELKYHYPDVAEDVELLRKLPAQEQCLLEAADLVLTVSRVNAAHLQSRGVPASRIRVIPNGVDVQQFAYQKPRRWPLESPWLLYAGTLSPWQGVAHALEALALYRRDLPAELAVAGEGRPRQLKNLRQLSHDLGVTEHVRWLGPMSQRELAAAHHQADVVLAPLRANDRNRKQGCCPLKVLEAMASGTPLIASDLEVVRELAVSGSEALLVRPGDGKAIKDALLQLRGDPHLAPQLSAAARRRVKQHFTWGHAQRALIDAYHQLIG